CIEIADLLAQKSGLEVRMWDERLTTVMSYRSLNSANVYGKKSKQLVDAVAAATILQGFIDSRRN
ncbi:MAG: Holliday junction resolvase RuvX, partial [Clostridia bacterium]|nr:Holliday junction resolvase RuvX [Clostridia bacterium]